MRQNLNTHPGRLKVKNSDGGEFSVLCQTHMRAAFLHGTLDHWKTRHYMCSKRPEAALYPGGKASSITPAWKPRIHTAEALIPVRCTMLLSLKCDISDYQSGIAEDLSSCKAQNVDRRAEVDGNMEGMGTGGKQRLDHPFLTWSSQHSRVHV